MLCLRLLRMRLSASASALPALGCACGSECYSCACPPWQRGAEALSGGVSGAG